MKFSPYFNNSPNTWYIIIGSDGCEETKIQKNQLKLFLLSSSSGVTTSDHRNEGNDPSSLFSHYHRTTKHLNSLFISFDRGCQDQKEANNLFSFPSPSFSTKKPLEWLQISARSSGAKSLVLIFFPLLIGSAKHLWLLRKPTQSPLTTNCRIHFLLLASICCHIEYNET